jgi:hypothetical protein
MKVSLVASSLMLSVAAGSSWAETKSLDYDYFKTKVQPIFMSKRAGRARCVSCHQGRTGLALAAVSPGATSWNEQQTRHNYDVASQLVVAGQPGASRLLMHPLAPAAGGDPFHGGGWQFESKNDPEWKALAGWVGSGGEESAGAAKALDFEFFRAKVEPILLNPRKGGGAVGGGVACFACHSVFATPMKLEPLPAGATSWSQEQSHRNFEAVSKLVTPGDPLHSRLLLQPLATEAGGTQRHTGGKFWSSQSDPEFQTLSEWVNKRK